LRSGETTSGPAVRSVITAQQGVLLLQTEPGLVVGILVHHLHAVVAEVELVGCAIGVPALSENDDVGRAAEGIGVDGAGAEVDVRVLAGSLVGGGTIKVPDGEVLGCVVLLGEGSGLGSGAAIGINPDVLSHDHALLIELEKLLESLRP